MPWLLLFLFLTVPLLANFLFLIISVFLVAEAISFAPVRIEELSKVASDVNAMQRTMAVFGVFHKRIVKF